MTEFEARKADLRRDVCKGYLKTGDQMEACLRVIDACTSPKELDRAEQTIQELGDRLARGVEDQ